MSEFKLIDIDEIPEEEFDEMGHLKEMMDGKVRQDRTATAISIAEIIPRKENFYIIDEIEELEKSIDEIGLLQPIVVMENKDKTGRNDKYVIVAGERRFTAYKNLFKKYTDLYMANKDNETYKEKHNHYSEINCYILNKEEEANEERIYKDTNDLQRNKNAFAYLCGYKPTKEWFSLKTEEGQKRRQDYLANCLTTEEKVKYEAQELIIDWTNLNVIAKHLAYIINLKMGNGINNSTVEKMLRSYWLSEKETILRVLKPENNGLTLGQYLKLTSKKTSKYQKEVLSLMDTGISFDEAYKEVTKIEDKPKLNKEASPLEEMETCIRNLNKYFKESNNEISQYAKNLNLIKANSELDTVLNRKIIRRLDKIKLLLDEINELKS